MHPSPTATNNHALFTHLREVLAKIPSFQSANHGYQGMVDATGIYALTGNTPWINFLDPGFHRQADGSLNPVAQRDAEAIFNAAIMVYTSKQNVKVAVNDALNRAVPKVYRRNPTVIGVREFRPNDDPRQIIASLTMWYGQITTAEVNEQDERWHRDWNPSKPIEQLIDRLEECYIFTIYMPPAYTSAQLIERAQPQSRGRACTPLQ